MQIRDGMGTRRVSNVALRAVVDVSVRDVVAVVRDITVTEFELRVGEAKHKNTAQRSSFDTVLVSCKEEICRVRAEARESKKERQLAGMILAETCLTYPDGFSKEASFNLRTRTAMTCQFYVCNVRSVCFRLRTRLLICIWLGVRNVCRTGPN